MTPILAEQQLFQKLNLLDATQQQMVDEFVDFLLTKQACQTQVAQPVGQPEQQTPDNWNEEAAAALREVQARLDPWLISAA